MLVEIEKTWNGFCTNRGELLIGMLNLCTELREDAEPNDDIDKITYWELVDYLDDNIGEEDEYWNSSVTVTLQADGTWESNL